VRRDELQRHHYYLCATLTPGVLSLGLGVARRVTAPVDAQSTKDLGLIGHEWATDLAA
jgi:hypothetical protein